MKMKEKLNFVKDNVAPQLKDNLFQFGKHGGTNILIPHNVFFCLVFMFEKTSNVVILE